MTTEERIAAWTRENTLGGTHRAELLLVTRLRDVIPYDMIPDVLQVIGTTCRHCYDDDEGCQCWNDA